MQEDDTRFLLSALPTIDMPPLIASSRGTGPPHRGRGRGGGSDASSRDGWRGSESGGSRGGQGGRNGRGGRGRRGGGAAATPVALAQTLANLTVTDGRTSISSKYHAAIIKFSSIYALIVVETMFGQ